MHGVDRVALVAWSWFIGWIIAGYAIGRLMFGMPGTGEVLGFFAALFGVFLWPWLIPNFVDDWMHDPTA